MRRLCARCLVEFRGGFAHELIFCKIDRFFVCRGCWNEGCQEGHGQGVRSAAMRKTSLLALVAITTLLLAWLPGLIHEHGTLTYWQSAGVTPIAQSQRGQTIKVEGVLSSPTSVAFGPHEDSYSCRSGTCWEWNWNESDQFTMTDGSGSMLVTTARWWFVTEGPHVAGYILHFHRTCFQPGDHVYVVGTRQELANGTDALQALIVSTENPTPPALDPWLISAIVGIPVAAWSMVTAVRFRRDQLNREAIGLRTPTSLVSEMSAPDPSLSWRPNRLLVKKAHRRIALGAAIVILGWPALFLIPALTSHKDSDQVILSGFALAWTMSELVVFLAWRRLTGGEKVEAVAFSDRGFHLWYASPYARRLHDSLIPWTEIARIVDKRRGRQTVHRMFRTDGEETDLGFLRRDNLAALKQEWGRRGHVPDVPPDSKSFGVH